MAVERPSADMSVRQRGAVTIVEFLDRRLIDTARIEALGEKVAEVIDAAPNIRLIISFEKLE